VHGRERAVVANHLALIRAFLRLARLFDTSKNAFCVKIFLRCEVGCAGVVVCEKLSRINRDRVEFSRRDDNFYSAETLIYRHFCIASRLCGKLRGQKIFCSVAAR